MYKLSGMILLISLCVLGYMLFVGSKPAQATLASLQTTPGPGDNILSCEQDSDCIPVVKACCDCNQGGAKTAVNRKYYSYYIGKQQDSCLLSSCQQVKSQDLSCTKAEPKCVNQQCQMR